jgi:hypothetical protein
LSHAPKVFFNRKGAKNAEKDMQLGKGFCG